MKKLSFVCLFLACLPALVQAQQTAAATKDPQKLIRLATLDWPPYTGVLLPKEGVSTHIATTVAKAAGMRLLAASFEWSKTLEKGEKSADFEGYFPEYYSKERNDACYLSQSLGASVLGVATLKTTPIKWTKVSELKGYKLGVVDGYVNGEELDAAIKDKTQEVEVVPSDAENIAKLRAGKVRGIVIDKNVLNYTMNRIGDTKSVVFGATPLATLTLHVCFRRTPQGLANRDAFDAALKKTDLAQLEAEYFTRLFAQK